MYCSVCGTESAANAFFCARCGAALRAPVAASPSPPPAFSPLQSATAAEAFDEEAWRAAIGPRNTGYYLPRFRAQHVTGKRSRWHGPAFLVTLYWLLYRKLWLAALGYFILPAVALVIAGLVIAWLGVRVDAIGGLILTAFLGAIFLGPAMFANSLYYANLKTLIEKQSKVAPSREQLLINLQAKGGTSNAAAWVIGIIVAVSVAGIVAAVAIPASQDYSRRAKASEAYGVATAVANAIAEYHTRHGGVPADLETIKATLPSSKYITRISWLSPEAGIIETHVSFDGGLEGVIFFLFPNVENGKIVSWSCRTAQAQLRYMPKTCRDVTDILR